MSFDCAPADVELFAVTAVNVPLIVEPTVDLNAVAELTLTTTPDVVRIRPVPLVVRHVAARRNPLERGAVIGGLARQPKVLTIGSILCKS